MDISATYICPERGLAALEPPEPGGLGRAARVAAGLGVKRLVFPVLEEPLMKSGRTATAYLDGLAQALDQAEAARLKAWLIAPARRVLGLDWVPPCLARGGRDPRAGLVFLERRLRNVWPYPWWEDVSVIQRRITVFRELVGAVAGHPALTGWILMDRSLEWARPDPGAARLALLSYTAEIREKDERGTIGLGLGWSELLDPEMARSLAGQVDRLLLSGLDTPPAPLKGSEGLVGELLVAAYLGSLCQWLFGQAVEVEAGWAMPGRREDPEAVMAAFEKAARQGLDAIRWVSLIDPKPSLCAHPPWVLRRGLERTGLLDPWGEPKENVESWFRGAQSLEPMQETHDFIDISPEEYLDDPQTHFTRLWNHFRD